MKLSLLVFAGLAVALATGAWLCRRGAWRPVVLGAVAGALILGAWTGRGIILSGYPLYPSTVGGLEVDWRVPEEVAHYDAAIIRSWPRMPGVPPEEVLASWDWLGPWARGLLERDRWLVLIPGLLAVVAGVGCIGSGPVGCICCSHWAAWLYLLVPIGAGVFWFWTAPHPRYVGAIFWSAAAGAITLGVLGRGCRGLWPRCAVALMAVGCAAVSLRLPWVEHAGEVRGFHGTPDVELVETASHFGVIYRLPVEGDQTWGKSLMATDRAQPWLRAREAGQTACGFADGRVWTEEMR